MPHARTTVRRLALHRPTVVAALLAAATFAGAQTPSAYTQPQPVRPNLPGTLSEEVGLTAVPTLVREGSFISSGRGQAVKGKTDRWFFIFDPDTAGRTLPPMVLLPNMNLAAVERAADRNVPGTRLIVTGQVTVYQGLNYLLLTAPPRLARVDDTPEPAAGAPVPAKAAPLPTDPVPPPAPDNAAPGGPDAAAPATPPAASPTPRPGLAREGEPSIDEIVARLDAAASRVSATTPSRPALAAPAPETGGESAAARPLISPGVIASRRGRITRASDGAMVFTFDTGASDAPRGAPMVLLPCQNLAAIEQISERAGENATYTVTGEVVAYRGRNYLLLRSYQANRATDQVLPMQ